MTRTRATIAALAVAMIAAVTGFAPPADAAMQCGYIHKTGKQFGCGDYIGKTYYGQTTEVVVRIRNGYGNLNSGVRLWVYTGYWKATGVYTESLSSQYRVTTVTGFATRYMICQGPTGTANCKEIY